MWLSKAEEQAYALLRVIAGGLFACHGAQKVFGFFPGHQPGMTAVMGYEGAQDLLDGVLIRPRVTLFGILSVVCGVLIAAGLSREPRLSSPRPSWPSTSSSSTFTGRS